MHCPSAAGRHLGCAGAPLRCSAVLKVAFDVACLSQSRAGTARVARGLLGGLAGLEGIEVVEVGDSAFRARGSTAQRLNALTQDLSWYAAGRSARAARRAGAAVVHYPTYRGPVRGPTPPMVVTVLDLAILREPAWFPVWARLHARSVMPATVRAASRVIAISRQTADDVVSMLGVPASRVRVVECGIDAIFSSPPESLDAGRPFLLGVGTPEPRKNLARLLDAFALLRDRGGTQRLVLVGADGWGDVRLEAQAGVELLGRVSDEQLRDLYACAEALVFPSLWEGFGLPVGEALAAGCRVVCSDLAVLREVAGETATYVDPMSPASIADGIESALEQARPAPSHRLTWMRAAQLTTEVWKEVAERG
jgi:glycosyltransferase involved in cell wall biosynthesis